MANLGTFTKAEDGSFTGTLRTLTLNAKVKIIPVSGGKENAPTHRIFAGEFEIGAAWTKTSQEQRTYYSVKIDDPSFAAPLFATLSGTDTPNGFALIWNRPGSAKHSGT